MARRTALRTTLPPKHRSTLHRRSAVLTAFAVAAAALLTPALASGATATQTLLPSRSVWRYRDNEVTGWERTSFADSTWRTGAGQLGAGDGDETTVVNRLAPAHPVDWFRTYFTVADRTKVTALTLSMMADDGAVVYLNGAKAVSDNMNWGGTAAASARTGAAESQYRNFSLPVGSLLNGSNTLAVAVFQTTSSDADVSFDASVTASVGVASTTTTSTTSASTTTAAAATVATIAPAALVSPTSSTTTSPTPPCCGRTPPTTTGTRYGGYGGYGSTSTTGT